MVTLGEKSKVGSVLPGGTRKSLVRDMGENHVKKQKKMNRNAQ